MSEALAVAVKFLRNFIDHREVNRDAFIEVMYHLLPTFDELTQRKVVLAVSPEIVASVHQSRRAQMRLRRDKEAGIEIDSCGQTLNLAWMMDDPSEPCPRCGRGTLRTIYSRRSCRYCRLSADEARKILREKKKTVALPESNPL